MMPSRFKLSPEATVVEWNPTHHDDRRPWKLLNGNGAWTEDWSEFGDDEVADWPFLVATTLKLH